ncbi:MAG: ABC transporter substrate-binding protein [Kurthia sp.]|nr:ABC transporter substrate-binding protein [Candidatus Kurthia equi]
MLVLAGCNASKEEAKPNDSKQTTTTEQKYPLKIKDANGEMVEIKQQPEKVVSLIPSNTEILYALGVDDKVVGVSDNDNYPKEVSEKEKIGGIEFNLEKIISLKPDLVLSHGSVSESAAAGLQQLKDVGITVVTIPEAENFEETYDVIAQVGVIMNKSEQAKNIITEMKNKVTEIQDKVANIEEQRSAYVEISDEPEIYTAGKGTFIQEMFDMLNIKNSATNTGWYQTSSETIIKENPDVILVMYDYVPDIVEKVKKRTGFQTISAVKNNRVVQISEDEISRTGPRLTKGLENLAKAVYPEVFNE